MKSHRTTVEIAVTTFFILIVAALLGTNGRLHARLEHAREFRHFQREATRRASLNQR